MPSNSHLKPSKDVRVILHHLRDEEKELKLELNQLEFSTNTAAKDFYSIKLHRVMESIDMATELINVKPECCKVCKRPL